MRRLAAVLIALLAFVPHGAAAAIFASAESGFSADFMTDPEIVPPQPSEKDGTGATLSLAVMYKSSEQSVFITSVVVDTFTAPFVINVPASLAKERDNFITPLSGTLTATTTGTLQGSPATFFSFVIGNGSVKGRGLVVILDKATPRIYVVTMVYRTADATPNQIAGLNNFIDSFKLQ